MLGWWIGRGSDPNSNREDDDSPNYPETPGPIFAARAFKSAIFGTPAPKDDDTYEIAKAGNTAARERSGSMSPTKRGILMTPGTATTRRKTVSFGANVEHEGKRESKSGIPDDCPGKFPSPWVVPQSEDTVQVTRRTNLTQTLENARQSTKKPVLDKKTEDKPAPIPLFATDIVRSLPSLHPDLDGIVNKAKKPVRKNLVLGMSKTEDAELDFTVDLNEPRSQSGRHWKREYEKYHEEAQERMGHLIRYKHLAKDYAKIKDDEAMEMREQLEREQQNVVNMESYIAKLISAIEDRSKSGDSDVTPELTKELARQTALAIQYKEQVEQFRAALEKSGVVPTRSVQYTENSSNTDRALAEMRRDLGKAREELQETAFLRSEAKRMKLDLSIAERKATKFKEENLSMAQQLEQCKAEWMRSERERKTLEEQAKKRSDILQALQKDHESLKQLVKKHRSDADLQLQQRHEQIATLRKELTSTRYSADSSESEKLVRSLQQKIAAHDKIVQEYEAQISKLRSQELKELNQFDLDSEHRQPKRHSSYLRKVFGGASHRMANENESCELVNETGASHPQNETEEQDQTINVDQLLDSMIPDTQTSIIYIQKENRSMLPKYIQSTTPRSSPSVLKDITNGASNPRDSNPRVTEPEESFAIATPGTSKRFADLSIHSPAVTSVSRATNRDKLSSERIVKSSPRPALVNIENTTSKPRQISNLGRAAQGADRASSLPNRGSLRTRTTLPPERAAAAKARLEQRKKQQRKVLQEAE